MSFLGLDVEAPDPRFGPDPTESERNGVHAVAFTPDGRGEVTLEPGSYSVIVSRGIEFEQARLLTLQVPAGGRVRVTADLVRSVDTSGWLAGDYHQHSQGSIDLPVPIKSRVIENLAEGIEFPAATDHDNLTDYRPHIARLHAEPFINSVVGDEVSDFLISKSRSQTDCSSPRRSTASTRSVLRTRSTCAGPLPPPSRSRCRRRAGLWPRRSRSMKTAAR